MIATYELPHPMVHQDQWVQLRDRARAEGLNLDQWVTRHIEQQGGAKVLNLVRLDFDHSWLVQVEHDAPLTLAGAQLKLAGE